MLVKGIIEEIALDGYSAKVRVPKIHRVATDPLGIPTEELDDATIISIPGVIPVYKIGDVVFVQFEDDEISQPVICGLLERTETQTSSAKLAGETSIDFAPKDWVIDELKERDVRISEKMITSSLTSYNTNITDRSGHFTVTIPNIDRLYEGLTIKVTITKDPYLREGYNTLDVNNLGPQILFSTRTTVLADNQSIRGAEYFLTYHTSGLGPYTVTSDSGAIPTGTTVVSGWIVTGGSGSFGDSPEYSSLVTRINGLQKEVEGNITTYVGEEDPTLYNYPTNTWQGKDYLRHIGNLFINRTTGDTFRFLAEVSAESLTEYPYGRNDGYTEESRGMTWTFRNGEVHYAGVPDCEIPNVPYLEVINKSSSGGRKLLPAGTYTLVVSTDNEKSDIGACLNLFSSATDDTHYSGDGSGLLDDGYRVLTTMQYDDVSWGTAIRSGYQTCVTFTINTQAWATISFRTNGAAEPIEGNARIYLFPATTAFEWSLVTDTDLAELMERMGAAEGTILVQGQDLSIIQGQINSKIWQTEIDASLNQLKVGGSNLISDTNTPSLTQVDASNPKYLSDSTRTDISGEFFTLTDPPVPGLKYGYRITTTAAGKTYGRNLSYRDSNLHMIPGETYTLSVYARVVSGGKADLRIRIGDMAAQYPDSMVSYVEITNTQWKQYSFTFTYTEATTPEYTYARPAPAGVRSTYVGTVEFCGMKMEFGNKATPWCECNERQITVTNQYSQLSQDVGSIRGEVSDLSTTVSTKADNSRVTVIDNRVSAVELTAQGLTSRVEATETRINAIVPDNYTPFPYNSQSDSIWTVNSDNSISVDGIPTTLNTYFVLCDRTVVLEPGTYTLSGATDGSNNTYYMYLKLYEDPDDPDTYTGKMQYTVPVTFTITTRCYVYMACRAVNVSQRITTTFKPMLEPGDEAHAFQDPSLTIRNMKRNVSEVNQTAEQINAKVTAVQEQLTSVPFQNRLVVPYYDESPKVSNGVTWTINGDNTVTATRTATSSYASEFELTRNGLTPPKPFTLEESTYAISGCPVGAVSGTYVFVTKVNSSGAMTTIAYDSGAGATFTIEDASDVRHLYIGLRVPSSLALNASVTFRPMLCTGDIPREYVNPLYCGPSLQNQLQIQESEIQQTAEEISTKVSQTDFTGNTIASLINQSATTVAITAQKINLTGAVTIGSLAADTKAALVSSVTQKNQYYLSTSNSSLSGGSWSDAAPTWVSGKYIWKRIVSTLTYQDGTTSMVNGQAGYDKALTDALTSAASAVASAGIKGVQPVYYRKTSSTAPSKPTAQVTATDTDTDGVWSLNQLKPKNGTYQFMCIQQQGADGTYTWSAVQKLSEIDVVSTWCSVNDKTVIDGAHIYAGSITSSQIATGTITVGNMSAAAKNAYLSSTSSVTEYYLSTSSTSATGGSWSTSVPTWASGKYIWIRTKTDTTNGSGTASTTYQPSSSGIYDKALTTALSDAATAKSSASTAQTTANSGYKSVEQIWYRSTSTSTPGKPTAAVTKTDVNTDNVWTLYQPKPKRSTYVYTCMQCQNNAGTYSWSTVRKMSEVDAVSSWCSANDQTYIDGAYLYTGSITAGKIAAGAITTDKLAANSITAGKIAAGAITADMITAGTLKGHTITNVADTFKVLTGGTIIGSGSGGWVVGSVSGKEFMLITPTTGTINIGSVPSTVSTITQLQSGGYISALGSYMKSAYGYTQYSPTGIDIRAYDNVNKTTFIAFRVSSSHLDNTIPATSVSMQLGQSGKTKTTGTILTAHGVISCSSLTQTSDARLKDNITPLTHSEDIIYNLRPVSFNYFDDDLVTKHGFIAQEVQQCVQDSRQQWSIVTENDDGYLNLNYTELIADLVATVQSQNERIKTLEARLQQ